MASVNKVILIGNLGKDPNIMVFDNNKKASFSLATSETYKDKEGQKIEKTEWHNIVCSNELADIAEKYLRKGMQIYLEGKLRYRKWEDKDGNNRQIAEVLAFSFLILSKKNDQEITSKNHSEPSLKNIIEEFPEDDKLGDLPF